MLSIMLNYSVIWSLAEKERAAVNMQTVSTLAGLKSSHYQEFDL